MRAARSGNGRLLGVVIAMACGLLGGCYRGTRLVTVTFTDRGGSSDYWVCPPREAPNPGSCHGRQEGDIADGAYRAALDVLGPPAECPNGVARLEIMVRRDEVLRVGYECALPREATGLPEAPAPAATGLPAAPEGEVTP